MPAQLGKRFAPRAIVQFSVRPGSETVTAIRSMDARLTSTTMF